MERVGRRADGWLGASMPLPFFHGLWAVAVEAAERTGRDPAALRRVFRVNPEVTATGRKTRLRLLAPPASACSGSRSR
ncbi:hypothetical protein ACFV9E_33670 [Streptomyces sp. NPDC059835]|uniref:hypothetical protein n=1 Tax=Streptomyces sp. NPDC059835 TaxID=3346967 RepID=UPI0036643DB4